MNGGIMGRTPLRPAGQATALAPGQVSVERAELAPAERAVRVPELGPAERALAAELELGPAGLAEQIHMAMLALDQFQESFARMPNIGSLQDAEEMLKIATSLRGKMESKPQVNEDVVKWLSKTARGSLPPLTAALGGVASQEVLKAVTGKFSPLQQWLYLDALELVTSLEKANHEEFLPRGDRYDALRTCLGETLCQKLHNLNVFLLSARHRSPTAGVAVGSLPLTPWLSVCCRSPQCLSCRCRVSVFAAARPTNSGDPLSSNLEGRSLERPPPSLPAPLQPPPPLVHCSPRQYTEHIHQVQLVGVVPYQLYPTLSGCMLLL
uniref:Uncharacterized protein n=1 Tax=Sphaerodactylus townsendi TaxID=933632 RepID=A0ACB8FSS8_9SAUR